MAITNFIRTIWDAELKQALSKKLVSQYFVNHNYEGAIMGAGSVKINQLADVNVSIAEESDWLIILPVSESLYITTVFASNAFTPL